MPVGLPRPAALPPAVTPPVPLDCGAPRPDWSAGADCCTVGDWDFCFFFFLAGFCVWVSGGSWVGSVSREGDSREQRGQESGK